MSNIAILTDEQGNFIGQRNRHSLVRDDMIAIAALWVENSSGEVLIAQRSLSKSNSPGLWGPAAAGTLEPGETFEVNVVKEAAEEIGLTGIKPIEVQRKSHWYSNGTGRYVVWFRTIIDWPIEDFVLQLEEVEQIQWISKLELLKKLETTPQKFVSAGGLWHKLINLQK